MILRKRIPVLTFGSIVLMTLTILGCTSAPADKSEADPKPGGGAATSAAVSTENTDSAKTADTESQEPMTGDMHSGQKWHSMGSAANLKEGDNFLGAIMLEDSHAFWTSLVSNNIIYTYKAQGYRTFCNKFVGDILANYFPRDTYGKVFPRGVQDPNVIHNEWQNNPNLVWLDPEHYTIPEIQGMANAGYLVLLSYTWTYGHLAFVGHENMRISTVPASPMINGMMGTEMDRVFLPVVVQAGTYTGVTSAGYASNGWIDYPGYPLFQNGTVRFYVVKK